MKGRVPSVLGYILEAEEAARCGITVPTLRKWRRRGYGPKAVKMAGHLCIQMTRTRSFLPIRRLPSRMHSSRVLAAGRAAPEPRPRIAAKGDGDDSDGGHHG